ncbi:hypothetical protein [Clostridium saccharobutylicum]|uniref:Lipoprotein n=3 Tax=Clostridium saccharobutylicum TaxID=169679 RepID=U5MXA6_CLOSA|nr:hypothetical protein [Clostridium saccharobutylicum]AGX45178.1 hypothetical protein CLSA_c42180 [Clostridium saccharobutylicum DSM 13864]AQR92456.1 hypothetical protein CLOSC_41860 [Clostridium saccharobutylicum]AQS02359.1 hypothetical protein CSACC_41920 [Clostridium saccharobutylicum]AQS16342.1 hypothetical protein CLOSACC_41920 [Clostridium saccharobutylicum]MBA2905021.1 hypothetical protein [Clostridium saccharobutylicum]
MQMKKLLSIGVISLTIASSTCVGVFAANNILSNEQKSAIQGIIRTYYAGGNPISNLNVNKDTKVSDIVNQDSDYYKKIEGKLNSYDEGSILVDSIKDGASIGEILNSSLIYASLNQGNFNTYKAMATDVANQLMDIDNTTDPSTRSIKEQKAADMIKASYGEVKFGKNSLGKTTVSLEKDNKIILQMDSDNGNKLIDILNSFNSYDELKSYLTELGVNV